jgi:hypothetical protein
MKRAWSRCSLSRVEQPTLTISPALRCADAQPIPHNVLHVIIYVLVIPVCGRVRGGVDQVIATSYHSTTICTRVCPFFNIYIKPGIDG